MACNPDFVQYIVDQCSGAGDISVKKMMGDWCIYCDNVLFGLICDNNLFIKRTYPGATVLKELDERPPYPGARPYFYISDVDDREYLTALVRATVPALSGKKSSLNPMIARTRQVPESLDDCIAPGLVCSQGLRAFFAEHLGSRFTFHVRFQKWLHENAGKTFRDAIEAYRHM